MSPPKPKKSHQNLTFPQFLRLGAYVAANAALLDFNITHLQARIKELYGLSFSANTLREIFVSNRALSAFCSRRGTVLKTSAPTSGEIYQALGVASRAELTTAQYWGENIAKYLFFPLDCGTYFFNSLVANYIFFSGITHWFFNAALAKLMPKHAHEKMMHSLFELSWNTANTPAVNWLVTAKMTPAVPFILALTVYCAYLISSTYARYKLNKDARSGYLNLLGGKKYSRTDTAKISLFGVALAGGVSTSANFVSVKTLASAANIFPFINFFKLGGKQGWLPWMIFVASFSNTFMYSLDSSLQSYNTFLTSQGWSDVKSSFSKFFSACSSVRANCHLGKILWAMLSALAILGGLVDMLLGKQLTVTPLSFFDFIYGATRHNILVPLPPAGSNWDSPVNAILYLTAIYLVLFGALPKLFYNLSKLVDGVAGHVKQAASWFSCSNSSGASIDSPRRPLLPTADQSGRVNYGTTNSSSDQEALLPNSSGTSSWCACFTRACGGGEVNDPEPLSASQLA